MKKRLFSHRVSFWSVNHDFRNLGLTLVEMLLVVSLMSVLALTLYQCLMYGLKIWERSQKLSMEEDIALFLDKIDRDLTNSFSYSLFKFEGRENRVLFPTMIRTLDDRTDRIKEPEYIDQLGQVEYYFNKPRKALYRRQANFGQALDGKFDKEYKLMEGVQSVNFFYYSAFAEGPGQDVEISPFAETIPLAIRIDIEFADEVGQKRRLSKLINIPVGS